MKKNDILIILGLLLIVIAVWIGISYFHATKSSTVPENISSELNPIDPNFDLKAIEAIKSRTAVNPLFEAPAPTEKENQATASASNNPEPLPILTPNPESSEPAVQQESKSPALQP